MIARFPAFRFRAYPLAVAYRSPPLACLPIRLILVHKVVSFREHIPILRIACQPIQIKRRYQRLCLHPPSLVAVVSRSKERPTLEKTSLLGIKTILVGVFKDRLEQIKKRIRRESSGLASI